MSDIIVRLDAASTRVRQRCRGYCRCWWL